MGLKQNNYRDTLGSIRYFGASVSNGAYPSASLDNTHRTGPMRNFTAGEGCTNTVAGLPYGYREGGSWSLPMKAGALSSYNEATGSGTISANALAVKLAEAAISGDGTLTAVGGLIVQALASISGSGTISAANLQAFLAAVANISGSGTMAGTRTGLGELISALTGSGAATSTLTATGELDADLTVTGTGLSTANVGQAVWSALAASNNSANTMGEKLNDAGSASNPWTEVIESGLTAAEVLRLILAVQAGKTDITGSTVTFRDVADTKDRVTATMTGSERTAITLDGS